MTIKNFTLTIAAIAALFVPTSAQAQVTVTSTTTTSLLNNTATCLTLTSATGVLAPGFNTPNQPTGNQSLLVIDQEAIFTTSVNGLYVCGLRGYAGTTAAAHVSGATVWVGPPAAFASQDPNFGQCVRAQLRYVPIISLSTGNTFDCLGLTTAGQITQTNRPGVATLGSDVASATTIAPTGIFFIVSGTTAVATITVPAGFKPGMQLFINPTGIFATTTAGNIGLITSATVVGRILIMTWDGTKFWPSYVS